MLTWFDRQQRNLPWRHDRDPYRIWVSEVMLQQTTVATVCGRFPQFLEQFPTVQSLADADEQDVLKAWEGMGYYRRARHLHAAAKLLVERHAGQLPDDQTVWESLPGVGRYILGAVLSQAFDRRLPIVEANTKRVLARLSAETGDLKSAEVQARLWQLATTILPRKRVGDFNQAMMELGALVCTPRQPKCGVCPLRGDCQAFAQDLQEVLPRTSARPAIEAVREVCLVPRHRGRALLMRRSAEGRWANMWEFPRLVLEAGEEVLAGAERLRASLSLQAVVEQELLTVRYGVTRFRMTMICLEARATTAVFQSGYYEEGRWLPLTELSLYPVSTPQRKLVEAMQRPRSRGLF